MKVITRSTLQEAEKQYPDAANGIKAWYKIVKQEKWRNFAEVRRTFANASSVGDYVVFNIRHNRYRLITITHYCRETERGVSEGHVYIKSFLTHKEYDDKNNWEKGVKK